MINVYYVLVSALVDCEETGKLLCHRRRSSFFYTRTRAQFYGSRCLLYWVSHKLTSTLHKSLSKQIFCVTFKSNNKQHNNNAYVPKMCVCVCCICERGKQFSLFSCVPKKAKKYKCCVHVRVRFVWIDLEGWKQKTMSRTNFFTFYYIMLTSGGCQLPNVRIGGGIVVLLWTFAPIQ